MDVNENVCRICLEPKATLNWNNELFEFCGVTYKDCYYHCTQLEETDVDPFSSMLCKPCSKELKNVHFFINKALESFRILQKTYIDEDNRIDEELNGPLCTGTKQELALEICLVSQSSETLIEHNNDTKILDLETEAEPENDIETCLDNMDDIQSPKLSHESSTIKKDKRKIIKQNNELVPIATSSSSTVQKKCRPYIKGIYICAYCSLILPNIYKLQQHEDIHDKNRERKEVCPHCGLKFYNKMTLKSHIDTHNENREKKYKCEFCEKAYFNRGALNVHRRIHLGQMRKCTLCPKEFYREIELNRHMANHSIIPVSQVKKTKYVVHCKDCNSKIPVNRWKAHKASHKNEPEFKCKICDKDFFTRSNCTRHIRIMHNKTRDEYETYIHYNVDKTRLSHLLLQQLETVQPV